MGESPVQSRPVRYAAIIALWAGYLAVLWIAFRYVPASQPAKDVTTFLIISTSMAIWAEMTFRLVQGSSLWDPRAWSA